MQQKKYIYAFNFSRILLYKFDNKNYEKISKQNYKKYQNFF